MIAGASAPVFYPEGILQPIRIKSGLNVSEDQVLSNIRENEHAAPWLDRQLGSGTICIVGGGPSLSLYTDKIRQMRLDGAQIMALNNAHDYLLQNKVAVDFAVLVDARKENASFYNYSQPNITYLLASQCHPKVFERLSGRDVRVWHSALGDKARKIYREQAKRRGAENFPEIGGGCTVGLRACYLSYALGFTDIHLFGFDSSFEEHHHAYPQALNDSQDVIEIEVSGKTFKTSPTMAKQAYQFQSVVMRLTKAGVGITVHGGGLLPEVHKEMHRPIASDDLEGLEARKYCNMWAFDEYRKYAPGEHYVDQSIEEMGMSAGDSLIDFGCGTGRGAQKFKDMGFDVTGIDHAPNCLDEDITIPLVISNLWNLPDISADFGYCTDVMEHIPPEKVEAVLSQISQRVRKCFFNIHTSHDSLGELIEEELHLTQKDAGWWSAIIANHFSMTRTVSHSGHSVILIGDNDA